MIETFLNYIPDKKSSYIIFDVGSRDCEQSIEFYHSFPNARIYAFECNPNTLPLCKKNIEPYSDRITLIEGAVCDHDGEISFYPIDQTKTITTWKDGNPGASSLFKSNGSYSIETYVQYEATVNCHRLDSVMTKYNIPKVDILWMDLQGAELMALKGLGKYIESLKYIHTEVSYREMYKGQVMFEELNQFILSNDFIIKNKLSLQGWQEYVIYEKKNVHDFHSIIINDMYVMVDCFLSTKYNSFVVILNNRTNILKRTGLSVEEFEYFWNDTPLHFKTPEVNDFLYPDNNNHKQGEFKDNFHIEVLYVPNIECVEKNRFKMKIKNKEFIFTILPPCMDYVDSTCMTTMFKNEHHLLPRWIRYHQHIGFEKFILYDNSDTPTPECSNHCMILPATWPYFDIDSFQNRSSLGQVIQQNHCLWKYSPKFLALTDLDEYINPTFPLFDTSRSVLAMPCAFFSISEPFSLEKSIYREDLHQKKIHVSYDKCIVHSPTVDLVCVHIPISFKNIYYAEYHEVQLNHYKPIKDVMIKDTTIFRHLSIPNMFDIVIPVGPNDEKCIYTQIEYTKKNVIGYRNIYLICKNQIIIPGCISIHELEFPFNITTVEHFHGKLERNGWYLQQLLKLYAGKINGILSNYLVIDADTFFLKPTHFMEENTCLYNVGYEIHPPYFEHMKRLHTSFEKMISVSGICHHMMFQREYVNELITLVENTHHDLFYNIFLKCVTDVSGAGASEYELYLNYMIRFHKDKIKIRRLLWKNTIVLNNDTNMDYMSVHHHSNI